MRIFQAAKRVYKKHRRVADVLFAVIFIGIILLIALSRSPSDFVRGTTVLIPRGASVSGAAQILKEKGIIRSVFMYRVYVKLLHDGKGVQAGAYLFEEPSSAVRVAYRTAYGVQGIDRIKVTIPEGLASSDIMRLIEKTIPNFDGRKFLALARPNEGYLFPDTYFFYENVTPEEVVETMRANFDKHVATLRLPTLFSSRSLKEVVIMASLIEEEASNPDDRRIISGILWKRIDEGMLLQVDAPFFYIFGKTSAELTRTDLATSSPYNTYVYKGLPPAPISNPGLDAIEAALEPKDSPYYFYLADYKGVTHYAADHDGHIVNIRKHLQ